MALASESLDALRDVEIDPEALRPEDDEDLNRLLEREHEAAMTACDQEQAGVAAPLDYYLASRAYQNHVNIDPDAHMSQMVSKDVAEVVDDLLPDILRTIWANDQLVEFEADNAQDVRFVEEVTSAVNQVFRKQIDIKEQIQDFVKSGLISRLGVLEIVTLRERDEPEILHSIDPGAVLFHASRPGLSAVELLEQNPDGTVTIKLYRRRPRTFRVEAVPYNELKFSVDADSLDQSTVEGARYVACVRRLTAASCIEQWPDKRDLWIKAAMVGGSFTTPEMADEADNPKQVATLDTEFQSTVYGNLLQTPLDVIRAYYRIDLDGDDYPELYCFVRAGGVTIHREIVHDNPFVAWTPYRIPHQLVGESQADKVSDIQDYKGGFLRIASDSAALAAMPRFAINHAAVLANPAIPTIQDALRFETGSHVRVGGRPDDMIKPLYVSDVSKPAMDVLDRADFMRDGWSGQSRRQKGLDPQAIANESGVKYDKLLSAGNGRKEYIAGNVSQAIQQLGLKMLAALTRYGEPMSVQIAGHWQNVDPAMWSDTLRPIVHLSGAVGSRDLEVQFTGMAMQQMSAFIQMFGPANPWIGPMQLAEIMREAMQSYGFRADERFVSRPDDAQIQQFFQALAQQKDPKITVEELRNERERERLMTEAASNKYRLDIDRGSAIMDNRLKALIAASLDRRERDISKDELAVEREKIDAQKQIAESNARAQAQQDGASD